MTDLLINTVMRRHRVTLSILVICVISGLLSYALIPKESNPDIDWPVGYVGVSMPGISPEDAERLIVRPLEEQMRDLDGLKKLEGVAYEGGAYVLAEFRPDVDLDAAILDVREKADLAERFFPADAEEPRIRQWNASEEDILSVSIFGPVDERTLLKVSQALENKLRSVPGVLEVDIGGEREELLEVVVDPARLETYGVTANELLNAVGQANRMVPAGAVDTGEGRFSVKVPSLFKDANEVRLLPVRAEGDGVIRLGDLGEVRRTFYDATGYAYYQQAPVFTVDVEKRYGVNLLNVAKEVKRVIREEAEYWPAGVEYDITWDMSENISENLANLISSIMMAVLLVMIIVFAALNVRSGLFVAAAIPSSFLLTFMVLNIIGLSLNIMVLFGLVIAVGLLVDGAIVVVEYADRKRAEGASAEEAFSAAAKRMFWPIVSSTGTTIAAFLPFLFWNSGVGKFMSYLPMTLIVVLSCALFVALIFLPVLGAKLSPKRISESEKRQSLAADADVDPDTLTGALGAYVRFVRATISRPVMASCAVIGTIIFALIASMAILQPGTEFFVREDPSELRVVVGANAANMSWPEKRDLVLSVEERLTGIEGVHGVRTRVRGPWGNEPRDTIGRIDLEFPDWDERVVDTETIRSEIKRRLEGVTGLRADITEPQNGPGGGIDITMEIRSRAPAVADEATDRITTYLRNLDGVEAVDDTRNQEGIEWRLELDRELAGRFGADVSTLGAAVQMVTNGVLVARYRPDDAIEEIDIRARFPDRDRGLAALDRARVTTNQGNVPISNFVDRVAAERVQEIRRVDGQRIIEIRADVSPEFTTGEVVAEVREWIDTQDFGTAQVSFGGDQREADEAQAFFGIAMIVGLGLIAFILLVQFNNFYHVFLTLTAVIFSVFGAVIGGAFREYMSIIMTGTGVVALAGIVVNNNIVFIDAFQRFRENGLTPEMAALRTAAQRVRPVLLTTATTMIGLSPLMFGLSVNFTTGVISDGGPNVSWWEPFATAIIWGLGVSTFITLILTPTLLAAQPRQAKFFGRLGRAIAWPFRILLKRPYDLVRGRRRRPGVQPAE